MSATTWPRQQTAALDGRQWERHPYPGMLVVVDGVDGSGRATQLELLAHWLQVQGYGVIQSSWNSSKLVSRTIREARRLNTLAPLTYSILHATDVAARLEAEIIPALKAGYVVLADRYVFTALARDIARGVDREWLYNLYGFSVRPDLAIYLRIDAERSIERIMGIGGEASPEEAVESAAVRGALHSFRQFQERVIDEYEALVNSFDVCAVEAAEPLRDQQLRIRHAVSEALEVPVLQRSNDGAAMDVQGWAGARETAPTNAWANHGYPGMLVVIEGADRSGRSTQVDLLIEWLAKRGSSVVKTDWNTSPHISKAIHKAKAEGTLRPLTYALFYAADFADRVANVIVPALRRGEIVVADRYIFTAFARDAARGADPRWLRGLFDFAPRPDFVFYLRVPPEITAQRTPSVPVKALDAYELGLDLGLSADPRRSFQVYQQRVFDEFERLRDAYDVIVLDGTDEVMAIQRHLRDRLKPRVPK
jgi:dTMP kinase